MACVVAIMFSCSFFCFAIVLAVIAVVLDVKVCCCMYLTLSTIVKISLYLLLHSYCLPNSISSFSANSFAIPHLHPLSPFLTHLQVIGENSSKLIFLLESKDEDHSYILNDKDTVAGGNVKNGDTISFSRLGGKRTYGANLCALGESGGGKNNNGNNKNGVPFSSSNFCPSVTTPANGFKTTKDSWSSAKCKWTQPQWIGYAFNEAKIINKISFLGANNAADSPVAYQFQGSNDGEEWTNIFEVEKGPLCNSKVGTEFGFMYLMI